ncbi:MAG: preprotein translocase subunit SecF [Candidatus Doudnabacteria bacterium Gr01-1014_77]|uniref:Protein-export membrane protein SecF n=1 Tax=Candidatus Doudnabacteria bacterium Gr01-1014_77 TaxID=2017133 RepID=A0A554JAL6_9BACT|nr:MAG: preprotein translocase subunit SecF [Candidatus Doudnabacteria bacterium Gr01-1014_77]
MLNIIKHYKFWFSVSAVLFIAAVISLSMYGLRPGLDFTGGSLAQISFKTQPNIQAIKDEVSKVVENAAVQTAGETDVIIKTKALEKEELDKIYAGLRATQGEFVEKSYNLIGPIVSKELVWKAIWQLVLVSLGIVFYIAYAFRKITKPITSWKFGWAAIIALLHDLVIVLGLFSILGHFAHVEVDTMFVTALLTVLGFSVHDTIVVFDRIRENLRIEAGKPIEEIVNHSINQTIVRSLNTSLTVLFVLLSLLLFGGATIKYFVLALFVGVIAGTYSSIFIASPILVIWEKWQNRRAS